FTTPALTFANNGQTLQITGITVTSATPNCQKNFAVNVTLAVNPLPQGSLTGNTICIGGTGQLTFTATSGTGPFTVVYNDGSADRTATNVVSGTPFNVFANPAATTLYTLKSVTDANGCARSAGFSGNGTITVNQTPVVNAVSNQVICNNNPTTAIPFSGANATSFTWTNSNTAIGLAASGSGNIASFTATNSGTTPISATITVTPVNTVNSVSCNGISKTFTIIVNPTPTLTGALQSATVCAGSAATINLTGLLPNTTSTITYTIDGGPVQTVTGRIADASGNATFTTPALTFANDGKQLTITGITVTSATPNCQQAFSQSVTLDVNPTSVGGTASADQTICAGTAPADLTLAGNTGNVIRWESSLSSSFTSPTTYNVTSATLPGATIGNLATTTYFRAVVQSGVCPAVYSTTVKVTVNPTPTLSGASQAATVCENSSATINLTGLLPGSVSTISY
ncbi:hypothetical protein, partial [Flavisolibacter nicotianae]|uniref:hypothetical protein n=1 Tax=Flavisolibacter nicotianae TaxID=2364882 RepID=UPI0013C48B41